MRRTSRAKPATSACSAGRWFAAAVSSTSKALPRGSDSSRHHAAQGLRRRERVREPGDVALAPAAHDGDEQVVERPEVVVELEARVGLDAARRHGGVAVAQHDALGRIEDAPALLGRRRSGNSGLDHVAEPTRRRSEK